LEGLTHEQIFGRIVFKSKDALVRLCHLMSLEEAIERIEQMDTKVATLADYVKYAVLQ
jgi:hypothetical protein